MKFLCILLCLLVLSACSEKISEESIPKNISCEYFTQHSRTLPNVDSGIELFEGQQFDGVLELKNDSVHFMVRPDSTSLERAKILVFIDHEETAPYRELISQQLPSGGYWIYYGCYDTLGKECFLPEFYDVDQDRWPFLGCGFRGYKKETNILQNNREEIAIDYRHFFKSYRSDSINYYLSQTIDLQRDFLDKYFIDCDTAHFMYKGKDAAIFKILWDQLPGFQVNDWHIHQEIITANNSVEYIPRHIHSLSEAYYQTNYQQNINIISVINQSWNDLYNDFQTKYILSEKEFTKDQLQQLPFQISSPLVYSYWNNSIFSFEPPPPPAPPTIPEIFNDGWLDESVVPEINGFPEDSDS